MDKEAMMSLVNKTLADEFELELADIVPEASFRDDLELDSLDAVDMVIVLEEAFGMKIGKDPKIQDIRTVADLYAFIEEKQTSLAL